MLATLSALQIDTPKGPFGVIQGGVLTATAPDVGTDPEAALGTVKEMAAERQKGLLLSIIGLRHRIQITQGK